MKNIFAEMSLSNKIFCVLFFIVFIVTFFTIAYPDYEITYRYSLAFIDYVMKGQAFDFYNYYSPSIAMPFVYIIPMYVITAVWNIPTYIASRVFHIDECSIGCLLWAKFMLVFFLVVSVYFLWKILKKMKYNGTDYALFLFISSLLVFYPVIAMGQCDCVEFAFLLCGVYFYLTDKRISPRTTLMFSIASSIKGFSLLLYLLLVLIEEKRILHIILHVFWGLLFGIITTIPFWGSFVNQAFYSKDWFHNMLTVTISWGNANYSVFTIVAGLIAVFAYLYKANDFNMKFKVWIWLCSLFWLMFFSFILFPAPPYRVIWYILFLSFLIADNIEFKKINTLLTTVSEVAITVMFAYMVPWVFINQDICTKLVLKPLLINTEYSGMSLKTIMDSAGLDYLLPSITAMFFVCGLFFIIINNPWKKIWTHDAEDTVILAENTVKIIRLGLLVVYLLITLYCCIHTTG